MTGYPTRCQFSVSQIRLCYDVQNYLIKRHGNELRLILGQCVPSTLIIIICRAPDTEGVGIILNVFSYYAVFGRIQSYGLSQWLIDNNQLTRVRHSPKKDDVFKPINAAMLLNIIVLVNAVKCSKIVLNNLPRIVWDMDIFSITQSI